MIHIRCCFNIPMCIIYANCLVSNVELPFRFYILIYDYKFGGKVWGLLVSSYLLFEEPKYYTHTYTHIHKYIYAYK